ncbi:hypothetical protein PN462_19320 [Spirulina sp. CS-785/01]|uniref:hypothetical protein n=1 Tax=Spirulina sp. CS-785/01 TaxID=3021716 RepID=UPI00232B9668|nr:hypothetical protein [Spirulina sp. CS-785/01]MDB9315274.1 hypothetical protein [Spirulina sp. CS-785/01]
MFAGGGEAEVAGLIQFLERCFPQFTFESFRDPESFSTYDPERDCCQEKLSDLLIESTKRVDESGSNIDQSPFSKRYHTPELLKMIDPEQVQQRCPLFKQFYLNLQQYPLD